MENQLLTRLQETLDASVTLAQEFNELLEKEKKQLTSRELESVTALLHDKEKLTETLMQHQQSILGICQSVGIDPSYGALRSFLYRTGIDQAELILKEWTKLKNALIKSQALNKTNEAILSELMRRNKIKQQLINNVGRYGNTYGRNGETQSGQALGWVEQV